MPVTARALQRWPVSVGVPIIGPIIHTSADGRAELKCVPIEPSLQHGGSSGRGGGTGRSRPVWTDRAEQTVLSRSGTGRS